MYADVIIGSSLDKIDRPFTYRIPENFPVSINELPGREVYIPFGASNRVVKGFVLSVKIKCEYDEALIKDIISPVEGAVGVESRLISMAYWLKSNYGGTMNDALHAVIPAPKKVEPKIVHLAKIPGEISEAEKLADEMKQKHAYAKERVLRTLIKNGGKLSFTNAGTFNTSMSVLRNMAGAGLIRLIDKEEFRDPSILKNDEKSLPEIELNDEQKEALDIFNNNYTESNPGKYMLYGITGSGKTEVYIAMMERVLAEGKQVIFLIPEIALTFQMIDRLSRHFAGRISMLNSRMSAGERYAQYIKAKKGLVDIVVGPRSALFTPFSKLGLIIVDEEHEGSYKSEKTPRYHAREVAIYRAEKEGAAVVLGSASPSLEAMKMVAERKLKLMRLTKRAGGALLPKVDIVDLREELRSGNRSVISRRLYELIDDRLKKGEQTILFINRRGYAGFVNCRSCGKVMKCPHCDISLTFHRPGRLLCHYCGYEIPMPDKCPSCGSPYIATFGLGTEKVEELVKKTFLTARILRMDADTTASKDSHRKILKKFKDREADILIGTQMIVKGHDFPNVTLVGILAADLSLYTNDYRAAERTFDLILQASGRAGRGNIPGNVVIQTYHPEHYAVQMAANGDYLSFYKEEMHTRSLAMFPPVSHMLAIILYGYDSKEVSEGASFIRNKTERAVGGSLADVYITGPVWASIAKIKDIYRKVIYVRTKDRELLVRVKNIIEKIGKDREMKKVGVMFDFDPEGTV